MGIRFSVPLPGPFNYSSGLPKGPSRSDRKRMAKGLGELKGVGWLEAWVMVVNAIWVVGILPVLVVFGLWGELVWFGLFLFWGLVPLIIAAICDSGDQVKARQAPDEIEKQAATYVGVWDESR